MSAGIYNITIDQGSDFALDLTLNQEDSAFDLTGYSARSQLRRRKKDSSPTATFTCSIPNSAAGSIKIELSNVVTASLTAGIYYYDLELFQNEDSIVHRVLQGKAQVTKEITRGSTAPPAPSGNNLQEGDTWYKADTDQYYVYRETSPGVLEWVPIILGNAGSNSDTLDAGTF